jgi:hypothetical protein
MPIVGPDRYTLFDQFYAVIDSDDRPCDYGYILELAKGTADPHARLAAGLQSARAQFARVGARPRGKRWVDAPEDRLELERGAGNAAEKQEAFRAWMERRDDGMQLRQLLYFDTERGGYELLSKWHHAAADAMAHLQVLGHQLRVAFRGPVAVEPEPPLVLRTHPAPVARSRYAFDGPSDSLAARGSGPPSRRRHWLSLDLDAAALRRFAEANGGFGYTDLLLDLSMQSAIRFNARDEPAKRPRACLFLTCNTREPWHSGMGNASSRLRIYGPLEHAGTVERCRNIREQVRWTKEHGEWYLRVPAFIEALPVWLRRLLLKAALRRSWSPGTMAVAHLERFGDPDWAGLFPMLRSVALVSLVSRQFPLIPCFMTLGQTTRCTITYDPALVPDDDARAFADELIEQVEALAPGAAGLGERCASA